MTSRTLVILRHAKAERPATADFDRPLTVRGHADASAAGVWLAAHGYRAEVVICSPAKRTRQTWHAVAVALKQDTAPVVRYEPSVYEGGTAHLFAVLQTVDPAVHTVLLIGHNPTVSLLASQLAGDGEDSDGLRTTGLAVLHTDDSWADLAPGTAELVATHTARGGE